MKRFLGKQLILVLLLAVTVTAGAQRRQIHIVGANDMHAAIENFPQLAAIIDSLRTIDPALLVLSAGDNRTGNPVNDMYIPSAYPMVALMNQVGFNVSAIGNHEFDMNSLETLMGLSNFRYVCANLATDSIPLRRMRHSQQFDVGGVRVGVIGAIELGSRGTPDAHPDYLKHYIFQPAKDVLGEYEELSRQWDVTILLSHLGYEDDIQMAEQFPWIDLIVGGHSHTQLKADEPLHNGVLITQNANKLKQVTHITLTVDNGKVIDKKAEYIDVRTFPKKNKVVENMVKSFNDNPEFKRVVGYCETPFETHEEIACMVCDAYMEEGHGDVGIVNPGGLRVESLPAGDITLLDVLKMDPFYNQAVAIEMTGQEIYDMVWAYGRGSRYHFPYMRGIYTEMTLTMTNKNKIQKVRLLTHDGQPLKMKKKYRVVTNSYMSSTCKFLTPDRIMPLNEQTADMVIRFLKRHGTVNYLGERCQGVSED